MKLKGSNINYFSYNLVTDVCTKTFFEDIKQDFFKREVYNLQLIMSTIANSQFKSFFKLLDIDTPETLNGTKSLARLKGLTFLSRFSLYMSRSGNRERSSQLLIKSFLNILRICKVNYINQSLISDWRNLHALLTWDVNNITSLKRVVDLKSLELSPYATLNRDELFKTNELTISNMLTENFKKFNYIFSFYIYKVDKQIYKNSRGKSGKYTFVWKYVAPYKRNFLIMHWLSKEVRISSGKTLQERLDNVVKNFVLNPHATWIWKIKRFSLNYVYFNLRRTLGETCKTSMR